MPNEATLKRQSASEPAAPGIEEPSGVISRRSPAA